MNAQNNPLENLTDVQKALIQTAWDAMQVGLSKIGRKAEAPYPVLITYDGNRVDVELIVGGTGDQLEEIFNERKKTRPCVLAHPAFGAPINAEKQPEVTKAMLAGEDIVYAVRPSQHPRSTPLIVVRLADGDLSFIQCAIVTMNNGNIELGEMKSYDSRNPEQFNMQRQVL